MAEPRQNAVEFPPLRRTDDKIADPGRVRLGDSCISGQFPPLRRPDNKIADPGRVRLGDSCITGRLPSAK